MARRLVIFVGVAMFAVGALGSTATAEPSGEQVGPAPTRLTFTRCVRATGHAYEAWNTGPAVDNLSVIQDDCLGHAPGSHFTPAEVSLILKLSGPVCSTGLVNTCTEVPPAHGCYFVGAPSGGGLFCDVNPGYRNHDGGGRGTQ